MEVAARRRSPQRLAFPRRLLRAGRDCPSLSSTAALPPGGGGGLARGAGAAADLLASPRHAAASGIGTLNTAFRKPLMMIGTYSKIAPKVAIKNAHWSRAKRMPCSYIEYQKPSRASPPGLGRSASLRSLS